MSEADLKVNSKVRRILTEHNLDLSLLSISSTSGIVAIKGQLRKLTAQELDGHDIVRLLIVLETVITRTKDVKRVNFSIKGWKKSKGKWAKESE
jgi:hypothetical protein